jgi:hypothetical protein
MLSFTDYNNKTNLARGRKYDDIFKQQGKLFNKYQEDIKDCVIKNNSEIFTNIPREQKTKKKKSSYTKSLEEGFQSAFTDSSHNINIGSKTLFSNPTNTPPSDVFITNYINKSSKEVKKTNDMLQKPVENTDMLQQTYNTNLTNYEDTTQQLLNTTTNYLTSDLGNSKSNTFKNIYVNRVFSGTEATNIGVYSDESSAPAMTILDGDYNYTTCNKTASLLGQQYFALQQYNADTGTATCAVSNNDSSYAQYGTYQPRCIQSSDANMYGTGWTNAIYSVNSDDDTYNYIGCYGDEPTRAMLTTGMTDVGYSSVYVAGPFGIGPWGSSDYIDTTANWIWYTDDSASNAPTNTTPVLILYLYDYTCNGNTDNCTMTTANIYGMCDNSSTLWVNNSNTDNNGTAMAISGGWGGSGATGYTVTINPGMNYIEVQVANAGGPAGLLLSFIDATTGDLLFNTNGSWLYSTIVERYTQPYTQSFSVDTCSQYAQTFGYQYFAVQDILNDTVGTAQCMLSNNLNTATQYGSAGGTVVEGGKEYGVGEVNVVYEMNQTGNINASGSLGYVNEDNQILTYPSSMIVPGETYDLIQGYNTPNNNILTIDNTDISSCMVSCNSNNSCGGFVFDTNSSTCWTKTTDMYGPQNISGALVSDSNYDLYMREPTLANNSTCPTSINEISSVDWGTMAQSGSEMSLNTKCQLAAAIDSSLKQRNISEDTLSGLYNTNSNTVTNLINENINMNKQMDIDREIMDTNLSLYEMINKKFVQAIKDGTGNINNILTNSQISVLQSNYAYVLWIILALLTIIFFVYIIRRLTITPQSQV